MGQEKDGRFDKFGRRKMIGHIIREDPNIDKEDTRPVELRKKPRFSVEWSKIEKVLRK